MAEFVIESNVAYWCKTEELANEFLEIAEKQGIVWCNGDSPTTDSSFEKYKEMTCYTLDDEVGLRFGKKQHFAKNNILVIEFKSQKYKYNDGLDVARYTIDIASECDKVKYNTFIKGDFNMARTSEILRIWKEKNEAGLKLQYHNAIADIVNKDKYKLAIKKLVEDISDSATKMYLPQYIVNDILSDISHLRQDGNSYCEYTDETNKKIAELGNNESKAMTKLAIIVNEINAQLIACETYAQEIDVLNIYGVLKDGKLNEVNYEI